MVERFASKKLILNNEPKEEPWNRLRKESNQAIGYLSQSTDNAIHSKYAPSAWKSIESCRADSDPYKMSTNPIPIMRETVSK